VCLVTWPLNASEAKDALSLLEYDAYGVLFKCVLFALGFCAMSAY